MIITEAKYSADNYGNNVCITCTLNGKNTAIPIDSANTDYIETMKQVEEGTLTIEDAD